MTTSCSPLASVASLNGGKRTDVRGVGLGGAVGKAFAAGGEGFLPRGHPRVGAAACGIVAGGGGGGGGGVGGPPPVGGGGGEDNPGGPPPEMEGFPTPGGAGGPFPPPHHRHVQARALSLA